MHTATPAAYRRPMLEWKGLGMHYAKDADVPQTESGKDSHVCECSSKRADSSMDFDGPALSDMAFALDMGDEDDATMFTDDCSATPSFGKCTCKQAPASPDKSRQPPERKVPRSPSDVTATFFESGIERMSRSEREALLSMACTKSSLKVP